MNLVEGFFFAFGIQAVILAFVLFFKKSSQKYQNKIWSIFLLLFSLNITYNVVYWNDWQSQAAIFFSWGYFLLLALYGPLFYFYVRGLVAKERIRLKRDFYHFIPFLFVVVNFIRFYILPFQEKQKIYFEGGLKEYTLISDHIVYISLSIGLLVYSWLSYKLGRNKYSNDSEMRTWSNLVVTFFFLFGISWLVFYALDKFNLYSIEADYIIALAMVFLIALTSYFGFAHANIFNGKPLKKVFPLVKYKNSGLSIKVMEDLKIKLADIIKKEALYLDCELKLTDLADKLQVSRHHASQIINESFGVSFYEYINKLRIEEAEKLLVDDNSYDLNITDIAFKCGFNNRVSFYNSFRKHIGMTPSEFRNRKTIAAS